MTWETGTTELTCEHCGARHLVSYRDYPVRDKGSLACLKCGKELIRWNGTRDYTDVQLLKDA